MFNLNDKAMEKDNQFDGQLVAILTALVLVMGGFIVFIITNCWGYDVATHDTWYKPQTLIGYVLYMLLAHVNY